MSEETQDNKVLPGWFVPADQQDKPEPEQVRYRIRGLAGTELLDVTFVRDELSDSTTMTSRGGNACLKRGLLGWENLTAPDGRPVAFDERNWAANVPHIPPHHLLQLVWAIWNRSFLAEADRKN